MKSILFRADANPSIGTGDLLSLIHLSHYFDPQEWNCYFMVRSYPASLKMAERLNKDHLVIIDQNISVEDEVVQINALCEGKTIDLLFFEITERPLSDYKGLNKSIKKACVNFNSELLDDLALVVNWDVDAIKYMQRSMAPKAKFLLGPEYVILPKQFYELEQRYYKSKPETLLIAMGGADELDMTFDILSHLIKTNINIRLNIIVGSGYQGLTRLEKALSSSGLVYQIKHDVQSMLEEYLNCDVAIGAGGLTASELVATRTPSILIATYKHQIARCQYFHDKGWAQYLGYRTFNDDLEQSILNPIKLTGSSVFNTQKIVDEIEEI